MAETGEAAGREFSSLREAAKAVRDCTRCPLCRNATQEVFGEQPGDREDIEGRPFVGPAGRSLDTVLNEVGIARRKLCVTNAVKHFKFVPRGKKRLHQKPNAGEISACRFWLDAEWALVRPQAIVALDAAAAKSLLGLAATITRLRDNPSRLEDGTTVCVTIHRSFLLRMLDRARAARERAAFAQDLAAIRDHMETVARASVTLDSASAGP